jgi:hypothetical protein
MTVIPDRYDFPIYRGASFYETITIDKDLTNCSVAMSITKQPKGDSLLLLSTSNGKITLNASQGKIYINLSAAETQALLWRRGKYEIAITNNSTGIVDIILQGFAIVEE